MSFLMDHPQQLLIDTLVQWGAMDKQTVESYILSFSGVVREYPFGESVAVYKVGEKMFALMGERKEPISLSLKCDPHLSQILRDRYESVMPGYHLNKKHWNTLLLSGQLPWTEVQDLIRHAYLLVAPSEQ